MQGVSAHEVAAAARARASRAAELLCRHDFKCWFYGDSVAFEGLLAASSLLGSPRYASFAHGAIKAWIPRAEPFRELDNTAPGHAFCLVYELTGDEAILAAALRLAEFLLSRRTIGGAFVAFERAPLRAPYGKARLNERERRLLDKPGGGVFVDCLHFDPPFLAHLGVLTGDATLVDAGARQALALVQLLQRRDTGLFSHFFLETTELTYGYGWGRGQGWALLGLLDVLDYLPPDHPDRPALVRSTERLGAALAETQDESGHWPALVQETSSYLETSTALFAATGLLRGVRQGVLAPEFEEVAGRAWRAGLGEVSEDGRIAGVSAAVWAATSLAHYRAVPTGEQVPWGQGPFLLAAKAHVEPSDRSGSAS